MSVNIKFDPSSGSQNQQVAVSGNCNPGIDETIQFQVQTEDGSLAEIINVIQEGKREVLMVSDGQGGHTEFMPSDGGTFNVVKEEWKDNPDCGPANGIYVYTADGQLVKPEEWDMANNDQAAGVAVIDTNCQFAISKSLPTVNGIAWSSVLYGTDVAELTNYSSSSSAQTDYAGQSNTNIIRTQASGENSSNNAAHYCYEQTLNGQHGYLPAAGELYTLWENKTEVNNALTTIGAITIDTAFNNLYSSGYHYPWSSTEYSSNPAWYLYWEGGSSPLGYGGKGGTKTHNYAFPVFPLAETGGGY